jgi:hypothetical protein
MRSLFDLIAIFFIWSFVMRKSLIINKIVPVNYNIDNLPEVKEGLNDDLLTREYIRRMKERD